MYKTKRKNFAAICVRGVALLTLCGYVLTTAAQDSHTKQAAPKARVIKMSKSPTTDRLTAQQRAKAQKADKSHKSGVAFRDDKEYVEYIQRIHTLRTKYGFMPKEE